MVLQEINFTEKEKKKAGQRNTSIPICLRTLLNHAFINGRHLGNYVMFKTTVHLVGLLQPKNFLKIQSKQNEPKFSAKRKLPNRKLYIVQENELSITP